MAGELLLDTGALVSLLDRSQSRHHEFVRYFSDWTAPVVSSDAVLTEATHVLGRISNGRRACLDFFLSGGAVLIPASTSSLRRCRELIEIYADLPMDYADASLVALAEELGTNLVFTTDVRDFTVYRPGPRRRFRIVPG